MKALLENIAAILGTLTAAVLAMSWAHEYGYFASIGRQFQTFLTTGDYLTNGVLWLPLAIVFIFTNISWKSLEPDFELKLRPLPWSGWLLMISYTSTIIFMATTITWPVEYVGAAILMTFVVLFWTLNWRKVFARVSLEEPFQSIAREVIRLGPPILIGMFLYGSVNAESDLTRTDNVYLFKFKDEKAHPQLYVLLRNFEHGVLVRDAVEKRIEF